MPEHRLVKNWPVTPHLRVAVEDSGNIVLTGWPDVTRQVDVPNLDALGDALLAARQFVAAVYPPAGPGRPDKNPIDRSLAYTALLEIPAFRGLEGVAAEHTVTEFLQDWHSQTGFSDMVSFAQLWWSQGMWNRW